MPIISTYHNAMTTVAHFCEQNMSFSIVYRLFAQKQQRIQL